VDISRPLNALEFAKACKISGAEIGGEIEKVRDSK
jgi:hypothetical protein